MNELKTTVFHWWEIESLIEAAKANGIDLGPEVGAEFAELQAEYLQWKGRKK